METVQSTESLRKPRPLPSQTVQRLLWAGVLVAVVCLLLMPYGDRPIMLFFREWNLPYRTFFKGITDLGNSAIYLIPSLLLAVVLKKAMTAAAFSKYKSVLQRISRQAFFLFTSIAVAGLVNGLIKIVLGRPRPSQFLQGETANFLFFQFSSKMWSFPSGHTNTAFALATALGLLFPKTRYVTFPVAVLIAVSRLVTGSHYLSDLVAGAFIGVAVTVCFKGFFIARGMDIFND